MCRNHANLRMYRDACLHQKSSKGAAHNCTSTWHHTPLGPSLHFSYFFVDDRLAWGTHTVPWSDAFGPPSGHRGLAVEFFGGSATIHNHALHPCFAE